MKKIFNIYQFMFAFWLKVQTSISTPDANFFAIAAKSDGVYIKDSAGTEIMLGAGGGSFTTLATQRIWTDIVTVTRTSDTVITWTASTSAEASLVANCLDLRLARWTSSDGATIKKGFIVSATASSTTITITLCGDIFASGDINFRISIFEKIQVHRWYFPEEQFADSSNPVGMNFKNLTDWRVLRLKGWVDTAAAGSGAALTFNVYDDGSAISTATDFTTNTSVDTAVTGQLVAAGSDISVRVPSSAGATNKAKGLHIDMYYTYDNYFDAV